ncbi:hypothetical protein EYF80_053814 [Liparis tanakae]|uniref:Uncharacterized protein n=1 Tax=Liparis tanakae TaxID=230148 RepID=A0A4Z2F594_9TELE|nr:hypothetical protein EYF80_053814 [Liparis tanakae]
MQQVRQLHAAGETAPCSRSDSSMQQTNMRSCDVVELLYNMRSCDVVELLYNRRSCDVVELLYNMRSCDVVELLYNRKSCDVVELLYNMRSCDVVELLYNMRSCDVVELLRLFEEETSDDDLLLNYNTFAGRGSAHGVRLAGLGSRGSARGARFAGRGSVRYLSSDTLMTPSSLGMITAALTTSWNASILLSRPGFRACGRGWTSAAMSRWWSSSLPSA